MLKNQWKIPFNGAPELFARVVPWRMQIFSLGDDQEGHFQAIFTSKKVPKNEKIFIWRDPTSDLGP